MRRLAAVTAIALIAAGIASAQTGNGYRWPRFSSISPAQVKVVYDPSFDQAAMPYVRTALTAWSSTGDVAFTYAGQVSGCYATWTEGGICLTTVNRPDVWWWGLNEKVASRAYSASDATLLGYVVVSFNAAHVTGAFPDGLAYVACHETGEAIGLQDHIDAPGGTYLPTCLDYYGNSLVPSSEDYAALHQIYQHVDQQPAPPPTCRKKHC